MFEKEDAERIRWVADHMSVTGTLRQSAIHMRRIANEVERQVESPPPMSQPVKPKPVKNEIEENWDVPGGRTWQS